MLRRISIAALVLMLAAPAAFGQWRRRADIQGDITDVVVAGWSGSSGDLYVSTRGSGVWHSSDGSCWDERNSGLDDLDVVALAGRPGYGGELKAATASGRIFRTTDGGSSWFPTDVVLGNFATPFVINDLAICDDAFTGLTYTYVATTGSGVLRQNGWNGGWTIFTAPQGIQNSDIVSVAAVSQGPGGRHLAVAGSRARPGAVPLSHLYVLPDPKDDVWFVANLSPSPGVVTFWSVAFHTPGFAIVGTSRNEAGIGQGVYWASAIGGAWSRVCASLPEEDVLAVDYLDGTPRSIVAGTPQGLWSLDDPTVCGTSPLEKFSLFRGVVRAIGIGDLENGWLGGPGKGPARFRPSTSAAAVSNVRCGLDDTNVMDVVPSPSFDTSDSTIFAASGSSGAYKSIAPIDGCGGEAGDFYRMIGDPSSWAIPPTSTIKPVPIYDESGCVPRRSVFAATNGLGMLRSDDGGRSWFEVNGSGGELVSSTVTDFVFDPQWNGTTNQTLYAAVFGLGVFRSSDGGMSWAELGNQGLANPRITSLGIADNPLDPDHPFIYAGCRTFNFTGVEYGLYRFDWTSGWIALAGSYLRSVSVVRLHPLFATQPTLLVGTEAGGVFLSIDGGTTLSPKNTNLPAGARISDLELSPHFSTDGVALIAVAPALATATASGAWIASHPAYIWRHLDTSMPSSEVRSIAFSPTFSGQGTIFAGHAKKGLFAAKVGASSTTCAWSRAAGFWNVPPNVVGVAPVPDDPSTVFAVSRYDGVFESRDGGDTFRPWGATLVSGGGTSPFCPVPEARSIAVTAALGYSFLYETFSSGIPATWSIDNGGGPCSGSWTAANPGARIISPPLSSPVAIIDSDNQGSGCSQDDWLVSPAVDTSGATRLELGFDHEFVLYAYGVVEHGKVKVRSSATSGGWVTVADYANLSHPAARVVFDLTPYRGTSFQIAFHYSGEWDYWWMVDNVWLYEPVRRVVVGTVDHGLYWADANDEIRFGLFYSSNVPFGTSKEVRYLGYTEDMRAAHSVLGDVASADFGATWNVVPGLPAGLGLADLSAGESAKAAERRPGGPLAFNGLIWGVSSGSGGGSSRLPEAGTCTHTGAAWKFDPGFVASWQACGTTGLDDCEDYRAVLELSGGDILLGAAGTGWFGGWTGLWRSSSSCGSWQPSNEGLPASPRVFALFQNQSVADRFVLAAVQDSDLGDGDQGGIYYSDATSAGRAWSRTTLPSASPGGYELAGSSDGTTIYTGLADDGLFSLLPAEIQVEKPAAFFTANASGLCAGVGSSVAFSDASAGKVTSRHWDFGDGGWCETASPTKPCLPNDRFPLHTYSAPTSDLTVTLTVTNGYLANPTDLYQRTLPVRQELDLASTLRAAAGEAEGEVVLSWTDLAQGESGYQIWASNDPTSGAPIGSPLGPDVTTSTVTGFTFYRVQPLGSGHVCGDGLVGGSW
jgi:hypothetical protein